MSEVDRTIFHGLAASVSEVIDGALAVDLAGGSSPAWEAILAKWGVPALGDEARIAQAKRERMYRGAPISEVAACLERIAAEADTEALHGFLAQLLGDAIDKYRAEACRKPAGGMFRHALASAREHKYAAHATTRGYVLECVRCGAPRLGGFSCAYCGAHLSGKEDEEAR